MKYIKMLFYENGELSLTRCLAAAGFILRAQLAQTTAQTAYIAMMGDVELPVNTDTVQQPSLKEGSDDDDEQMV